MKETHGWFAIYSRKSKYTGKGESIENQISLCRDHVRRMFPESPAEQCLIFEDEGFSGGNLNRPGFRRMMEQIRQGGCRAVVVYRLDRISRNIGDFAGLIGELTGLGVSFISIREQFDTGTPMGRAMMYIISVFSQLERETIAERIRDNMLELAKTGRWLGGNTPTGYVSESISHVTVEGKTRKTCHLKPVPEEAEMVKAIFDLYCRTDSLTAVETELLRRRWRSKFGNLFSRFSIREILRNPVYAIADGTVRDYFSGKGAALYPGQEAFDGKHGLMVYNRTLQEKGHAAVRLPVTEWIVAVGKHPGLIPGGQWVRVQEALERNRSRAYGKPRQNPALLTGLLFCSCGERMYPRLSGRITPEGEPGFSYVCKGKEHSKGSLCAGRNAAGNVLDRLVLEQIRLLPEHMPTFLAGLEKSRKALEEAGGKSGVAGLRAECAENERKIQILLDTLCLPEDSAAKQRILCRIKELEALCEALRKEIREQEAVLPEARNTACPMVKWTAFSDCVTGMTPEGKRDALRMLIRRIVWDGQDAHVWLWGTDDGGMAG